MIFWLVLFPLGSCVGWFVLWFSGAAYRQSIEGTRQSSGGTIVWELEFGRVSHEGSLHVQGSDDPSVPGRERRSWTPLNLAMYLVVGAIQRRDEQRLSDLREIGARLIEDAGGKNAQPTVIRWAAHLDWNDYSVVEQDGQFVIKANVPEEVTQALAPVTADIERHEEMYRLLNRYRLRHATPYRFALAELPPAEELASDFQTARRLEELSRDELR